ncbi:MAG: hypothetical protein ACJA1C_002779 [Crocinitomicaceae bacterium]|jgi:hypothetical protein
MLSLSAFSILAPLIVGFVHFQKLSLNMKILYILIVITFVMEAAALILRLQGIRNLFIFHSYVYVEITVVMMIYYRLFDTFRWKLVAVILYVVFIVFSILNVEYVEGLDVFNSNQRYVEGLIIILLCVTYFVQLMRRAEHRHLHSLPSFWLNSGFLIYFSGTLFLFMLGRDLIQRDIGIFWEIHALLNILLNTVYVIALLKAKKQFVETK